MVATSFSCAWSHLIHADLKMASIWNEDGLIKVACADVSAALIWCLHCNLSTLQFLASKMQIFGEFSEESKSPEVDQPCLFHCSNSASHEAQTGILDLIRTERLIVLSFFMRISVIAFFSTCSCACTCLGLIEQQMYYQLKIEHT